PICKLLCSGKKIFAKRKAKIGFHKKLILNAEMENFTWVKDFLMSFIAIPAKVKKSRIIKKNSIKLPDRCSMCMLLFPSRTPKHAEKIIKTGCNVEKILIHELLFQKNRGCLKTRIEDPL
ncbi:MAG: hypothetical protein LBF75_02815, partial [Treponema sp.]|nr:hypothetical protein [Treponema sp.]